MTDDTLDEPVQATIRTLADALQSWFGPVVNQAMGKPAGSYIGNAYWVPAAASVWFALRQRQDAPVSDTTLAWLRGEPEAVRIHNFKGLDADAPVIRQMASTILERNRATATRPSQLITPEDAEHYAEKLLQAGISVDPAVPYVDFSTPVPGPLSDALDKLDEEHFWTNNPCHVEFYNGNEDYAVCCRCIKQGPHTVHDVAHVAEFDCVYGRERNDMPELSNEQFWAQMPITEDEEPAAPDNPEPPKPMTTADFPTYWARVIDEHEKQTPSMALCPDEWHNHGVDHEGVVHACRTCGSSLMTQRLYVPVEAIRGTDEVVTSLGDELPPGAGHGLYHAFVGTAGVCDQCGETRAFWAHDERYS